MPRYLALGATTLLSISLVLGTAIPASAGPLSSGARSTAQGIGSTTAEQPVPTISGSARVGQLLTVDKGVWPATSTVTVQWYSDHRPIDGATDARYVVTADVVGTQLNASVSGVEPGHDPVTVESAPTGLVGLGTLLGAVPTISGTAKVGSSLSANAGQWSRGTTIGYQWFSGTKSIPGATAAKYAPTATVVGQALTVRVTGSLDGYNALTKASKASAVVASGTLVGAVPVITGSAKVGVKLTVKPGSWTAGTRLSYQWYAAGKALSGATASTYIPASSVVGKSLTVRVAGNLGGYTTLARASKVTANVLYGTLTAPTPKVSGSARIGNTLTATAGSWTTGTSLRYQWLLNGTPIAGATKPSLAISSVSWKGKALSVTVTGTKSGYTTSAKRSASTAGVVVPGSTTPSGWNCPSWAPIKGNASSMIYHMPGQRFYDRTNPEECFSSESAARNAGYRAAKV